MSKCFMEKTDFFKVSRTRFSKNDAEKKHGIWLNPFAFSASFLCLNRDIEKPSSAPPRTQRLLYPTFEVSKNLEGITLF